MIAHEFFTHWSMTHIVGPHCGDFQVCTKHVGSQKGPLLLGDPDSKCDRAATALCGGAVWPGEYWCVT
jgi:hypothetical protein